MSPSTQSSLVNDILDLESPTGLTLSPNGTAVAYTTKLKWNHKRGKHHSQSIWAASIDIEREADNKDAAQRVTDGSFNDRMPQWTPDGKSLAFLSDRGGRGKTCTIYQIEYQPLNSGTFAKPRAITSEGDEMGISKFRFSPDGRFIAFLRQSEKSPEQKTREEEGDDAVVWGQDWEYTHLWLVDVSTGNVDRAFLEKDVNIVEFAWHASGNKIALVTQQSPHIESQVLHGTKISVLSLGKGEQTEPHTVCEIPMGLLSLQWIDEKLYFLTYNVLGRGDSGLALYEVDLSKNDTKTSDTCQKIAYGVDSCASSLRNANGKLAIHVLHNMEHHIHLLNGTVLFSQKKSITDFDASFDQRTGQTVLVIAQGDVNNPTELFSTLTTGKRIQLSNHGSKFAERDFGKCEFLHCQTTDGKEQIDGLYIAPNFQQLRQDADNKPTKRPPTFVYMHGGPYNSITDSFDSWDPIHIFMPLLLSEGYGVLIPNYRGSNGKGERFARYADGSCGVYDDVDIVAMTQHAIDSGYADPSRIIAGGWSQGGFLAYLISVRNGTYEPQTQNKWKYKGLIAGAGITEADSMTMSSDIGYEQAGLAGAAPWTVEKKDISGRKGSALWEFHEAVTEGGRIPPLLILHGECDERVPVSQAWGFRRAMDQAGLPFEMVTYPREGHFFAEKRHIVDLMQRVVRFVKKHC